MKCRMTGIKLAIVVCAALACMFEGAAQADHMETATQRYLMELNNFRDSRLTEVTNFGTNPGRLKMYKFVPTPEPTNAPLVVALHGTTQNANDYAARTEWNKLAQRYGFVVLYPEQQRANNQSLAFNWFEPAHCRRDRGEAGSVMQMINQIKKDHSIDEKRVFVEGISSGGCFTAVLCSVYPDVFAGGGVVAGIPFRAAETMNGAFMAMFQGVVKTPEQWAKLVMELNPDFKGRYPRMVVIHGTNDTVVKPVNMKETVKQFTALHGVGQTPSVTKTVKGQKYAAYKNDSGEIVVETYEIPMSHGIPIDPGTGADQGVLATVNN